MWKWFIGVCLLLAVPCFAADKTLTWDASPGATGYKLQISTDLGTTWGEIRDAGNVTTYTWLDAPDTGTAMWRVGAYNVTSEAWNTDHVVVYSAGWKPPAIPTGLGVK